MFLVNNLIWLDPDDDTTPFPSVDRAMREPDGLLALGGSLRPKRLLAAYRRGIFPWYNAGQPILWWSPNPRAVLFPDRMHISRSLRKTVRNGEYHITLDSAFPAVIQHCAEPRPGTPGTWLTAEMIDAYTLLHQLGYAHSAEAWWDGQLVGGLYGIALGNVFFGESMFSRRSDASKAAFVHLVRQLQTWGYALIDCQVASPHLRTLGAEEILRTQFVTELNRHCASEGQPVPWRMEIHSDDVA